MYAPPSCCSADLVQVEEAIDVLSHIPFRVKEPELPDKVVDLFLAPLLPDHITGGSCRRAWALFPVDGQGRLVDELYRPLCPVWCRGKGELVVASAQHCFQLSCHTLQCVPLQTCIYVSRALVQCISCEYTK